MDEAGPRTFSLGAVAGAGGGALAAAIRLPVPVHLGALGVLTVAVGVVASRHFLPHDGANSADPADPADRVEPVRSVPPRLRLRAAWREPRTLLVGVLVLSCALSEGIANDWLAVGLVDGFLVSNAVGAAGFAVFVAR